MAGRPKGVCLLSLCVCVCVCVLLLVCYAAHTADTGEDVVVHSFGDQMSPRVLAGTVENTVLYRTMMGHFGLPLQNLGAWQQQQQFGVVVNGKRGQGRINGRKNLEYGHHD